MPSAESATCALFARVRPAPKLIDVAFVAPAPPSYNARLPAACGETTVRFNDTTTAVDGIPHVPASGNVRVPFAASEGPPSGPCERRVSTTRQGWRTWRLVATGDADGRHPSCTTSKSLAWIAENAGFRTPLSQRVSYVP